jgi:hypothetical protein
MEYWSLEQAKLGKAKEAPLAGQVALVTGAAGAIGFAVCRKLVEAGRARRRDRRRARAGGRRRRRPRSEASRASPPASVMDVTDERSVGRRLREACRLYGGVDVLVLNAGIAHVSAIEATDPAAFRPRRRREPRRLFPRAARSGAPLPPPGDGGQRDRQLVEERLRTGGGLRRVQRLEGGRAPAREGRGARARRRPACAST